MQDANLDGVKGEDIGGHRMGRTERSPYALSRSLFLAEVFELLYLDIGVGIMQSVLFAEVAVESGSSILDFRGYNLLAIDPHHWPSSTVILCNF